MSHFYFFHLIYGSGKAVIIPLPAGSIITLIFIPLCSPIICHLAGSPALVKYPPFPDCTILVLFGFVATSERVILESCVCVEKLAGLLENGE
jgi:hypothetical protein